MILNGFFILSGDVEDKRAGDADRGENTTDDTDEESEDETTDYLATENEHHEQSDKSGAVGINSTSQCRVDSVVEVRDKRTFGIEFAVFADTVEDNNGGVDRVTDDGQHCGDERLVDIEVEREESPEEREHTDNQDSIVGKSGDATHTETPAAETEADIDKDDKEATDDSEDRRAFDVVGDSGSDLFGLDDAERVEFGRLEFVEGDRRREEILGTLIEFGHDFILDLVAIIGDAVFGGNLQLIGRAIGLDFRGLSKLIIERRADIDSADGLVEANDIGATAAKVDTEAHTLEAETCDTDEDSDGRDSIEDLTFADKVDMDIAEEIFGEWERETNFSLMVEHRIEDETGDENTGKKRGDDTYAESDSETLDGARAESDKHKAEEESSDLAVDNSGESILEARLYSIGEAGAGAKFLLDTFIDNNVAVDSHSHGQDNTGDARHSEYGADGCDDTHKEEDVGDKSDNGDPAGTVVEDDHIDKDDEESEDERDKAAVDRFLTERRSYDGFLNDNGRSREFTGFEDIGEVLSLFEGEVACNLRAAAGDLAVDDRSGIDEIIEDDSDAVADILAGDTFPFAGALVIHLHRNLVTAIGREVLTGIGDDATIEESGTVARRDLDGKKLVDIDTFLYRLSRPEEFDAAGVELLAGSGLLDKVIDSGAIFGRGVTDDRATADLASGWVDIKLHKREQGMILGAVGHCLIRRRGGLVAGGF